MGSIAAVRISALVAAVLSVGACTDAGRVLFIVQNNVPEPQPVGCTIQGSLNSQFRQSGAVDLTNSSFYQLTPVMMNLAARVSGDDSKRVAIVQGAEVSIEVPAGSNIDLGANSQRTLRFTGAVFPDGGTTGFAIELLSEAMLEAIANSVTLAEKDRVSLVVEITAFATMDGNEVESERFFFPLDVCDGCLLRVADSCDITPPSRGYECYPQVQDVPTICCLDASGGTICP
jgi:hypothetical protein